MPPKAAVRSRMSGRGPTTDREVRAPRKRAGSEVRREIACAGDEVLIVEKDKAQNPEPPAKRGAPGQQGKECRLAPLPESSLSEGLLAAAQQLPPDVFLVASDGSRHPAHRLIVAATSHYFLTMLSSGMCEAQTGEVRMDDIEPEFIQVILNWMYSRDVVVEAFAPEKTLRLLEIAERLQADALIDHICCSEACTVSKENVAKMWEAAARLNIAPLMANCRDFVRQEIAAYLAAPAAELPAAVRAISAEHMASLLEDDALPVQDEEGAFKLAWDYILEHKDTLKVEEAERCLMAIRWRLIPAEVIGKYTLFQLKVDAPRLTLDETNECLRLKLLAATHDGMNYQLQRGQATKLFPSTAANKLREKHRLPVRGIDWLFQGMRVQIISDVDMLRSLCRRCAPGARLKVEWIAEMKNLAGVTCTIKEIREEIAGAQVEYKNGEHYFMPFDALLLA